MVLKKDLNQFVSHLRHRNAIESYVSSSGLMFLFESDIKNSRLLLESTTIYKDRNYANDRREKKHKCFNFQTFPSPCLEIFKVIKSAVIIKLQKTKQKHI